MSDRQEIEALRGRYASQFDVPDGGRYANDWPSRIDRILASLAESEAREKTLREALRGIVEWDDKVDDGDESSSLDLEFARARAALAAVSSPAAEAAQESEEGNKVHSSVSRAETQAGLNGPSGSPHPSSGRVTPEETLRWIADSSYVGNYDPAQVVEIHRKWARAALGESLPVAAAMQAAASAEREQT